MPLEKQYDRKEVLEKATHAFWTHGYQATSISDLVEEAELSRGSLYAAFDGKRGLFVECLAHYDQQYRSEFLASIAEDQAPLDAIQAVFEAAARPARSPSQSQYGLRPPPTTGPWTRYWTRTVLRSCRDGPSGTSYKAPCDHRYP